MEMKVAECGRALCSVTSHWRAMTIHLHWFAYAHLAGGRRVFHCVVPATCVTRGGRKWRRRRRSFRGGDLTHSGTDWHIEIEMESVLDVGWRRREMGGLKRRRRWPSMTSLLRLFQRKLLELALFSHPIWIYIYHFSLSFICDINISFIDWIDLIIYYNNILFICHIHSWFIDLVDWYIICLSHQYLLLHFA